MSQSSPDGDALSLKRPEILRLSSWMAALNGDIPARVLAAISSGQPVVLISSAGGVAAETRYGIVERLNAAEILTVARRAPFSRLDALHDAIRDALPRARGKAPPIALLVDRAERLGAAELRRLQALADLRRQGRPVLHVLLIATPEIQARLREAGLGRVWDDASAHLRLVPELAACLPQPPGPAGQPGTWAPPPEPHGGAAPTRRMAAPRAAASALVVCGIAVLGWSLWPVTRHRPSHPVVKIQASLKRQMVQPAPLHLAIRRPPPTPRLAGSPLHVTLRFRGGDALAAATARRILSQLRQQGLVVDGPWADASDGVSRLAYGFAQDRDAAIELARGLGLPTEEVEPARPGEIAIFIGAADPGGVSIRKTGKTT